MLKRRNADRNNKSDSIREYVRATYVEPARKRGEKRIRVVAGDVHTGLGLRNRVPLVCNALRSRDLLAGAGLRIVADEGPPSGQSTTVAITYEVLPAGGTPQAKTRRSPAALLELRGVARESFKALGGGEAFIRREREAFFGREKK
jgi:hypothetical protein